MPIFPLKTPDLHYFLISFDARGKELPETDGSVGQQWMSVELQARLRRTTNPVSDIFLVCHGWNTSATAAHNSYVRWMSAMADDNADVARAGAEGRHFNPLLIGVQWPSKFGDIGGAALPADVIATALDSGGGANGGDAHAAAVDAQASALAAGLDNDDAARLAADPAAAAALKTLAAAAVVPAEVQQLLDAAGEVASAASKSGVQGSGRVAAAAPALGSAVPATAPAASGGAPVAAPASTLPSATLDALAAVAEALEPLSEDEDGGATGGPDVHGRAEAAFRLEATAAMGTAPDASATAAAATADSGGLLFAPLRLLLRPFSDVVFAAFQRRAAHLGRTAVHDLLADLMAAAGHRATDGSARFHAVGHSLGAHMVSGAALGRRGGRSALPARLHSAALIQAAVPAAAFRPGGAYRRLVEGGPDRPVAGPVVLTHSATDRALSSYALLYGPPLGAVGADADLGPTVASRRALMVDAKQAYTLAPEELVSVDAGAFVDEGAGGVWDVVGSHMDITDDPVSHLVWEAVLTVVPVDAYAATGGRGVLSAGGPAGGGHGGGLGAAAGGVAASVSHGISNAVGGVGAAVGATGRAAKGTVDAVSGAVGAVAGAGWRALRWALPPY